MSSRLGRLDCDRIRFDSTQRGGTEIPGIAWDSALERAATLGARDSDELETNTTFANVKAEFLKIATDRPHTLHSGTDSAHAYKVTRRLYHRETTRLT